jgi:hypothetical protein
VSYGGRQKLDSRIKSLLASGGNLGPDDEKLKAEIARLACVLAAAYIEVACQEIVEAYAFVRAEPSITRYVAAQLGWFQNPSLEKILKLAGQLDASKRDRLEGKVSDELKDSVGSIMGHRNNIAHGRDSSITLGLLSTYYESAKRFMQEFEALFPPTR